MTRIKRAAAKQIEAMVELFIDGKATGRQTYEFIKKIRFSGEGALIQSKRLIGLRNRYRSLLYDLYNSKILNEMEYKAYMYDLLASDMDEILIQNKMNDLALIKKQREHPNNLGFSNKPSSYGFDFIE